MIKFIRNLFKGRKQQCNIPDVINRFLFIPFIIIKSWLICIVAIIALPLILFDIDIIEPFDNWTDKYSPI